MSDCHGGRREMSWRKKRKKIVTESVEAKMCSHCGMRKHESHRTRTVCKAAGKVPVNEGTWRWGQIIVWTLEKWESRRNQNSSIRNLSTVTRKPMKTCLILSHLKSSHLKSTSMIGQGWEKPIFQNHIISH